jgi:hypothetical protein
MPLDLENRTPFACGHPPMLAKNGATILRIIVRATYELADDGRLTLAPEQAPVRFEDAYWGEPAKSSLRHESDVSLEKPFTDVVVHGHACAPDGRPVTKMEVSLAVGSSVKRLQVVGDRRWERSMGSWLMTPPSQFTTMPVTYDRAFGGMDAEGSESRNRVGRATRPASARSSKACPFPTSRG